MLETCLLTSSEKGWSGAGRWFGGYICMTATANSEKRQLVQYVTFCSSDHSNVTSFFIYTKCSQCEKLLAHFCIITESQSHTIFLGSISSTFACPTAAGQSLMYLEAELPCITGHSLAAPGFPVTAVCVFGSLATDCGRMSADGVPVVLAATALAAWLELTAPIV